MFTKSIINDYFADSPDKPSKLQQSTGVLSCFCPEIHLKNFRNLAGVQRIF